MVAGIRRAPVIEHLDEPALREVRLHRSLVTVSALIASGQMAQVPYHLNRAMDNGLSRAEAAEVMTQLAFYAGWPNAFSALSAQSSRSGRCASSRDGARCEPSLAVEAVGRPGTVQRASFSWSSSRW
jgi:hypothetical protein